METVHTGQPTGLLAIVVLFLKVPHPRKPQSRANGVSGSPSQMAPQRTLLMPHLTPSLGPCTWAQLLSFAADAHSPPLCQRLTLTCLARRGTYPTHPLAPSANGGPTQGNQRLNSWQGGVRLSQGRVLTLQAPALSHPPAPLFLSPESMPSMNPMCLNPCLSPCF